MHAQMDGLAGRLAAEKPRPGRVFRLCQKWLGEPLDQKAFPAGSNFSPINGNRPWPLMGRPLFYIDGLQKTENKALHPGIPCDIIIGLKGVCCPCGA